MINFRHTGIYVSDLSAMEAFYRAVFQMKAVCSAQEESGPLTDELFGRKGTKIRTSKLITPFGVEKGTGDMIELVEVMSFAPGGPEKDRPVFRPGTAHVAFGVDDISETAELIRRYGGTMETKIVRMANGNDCAFARDVEGNWLELIRRD